MLDDATPPPFGVPSKAGRKRSRSAQKRMSKERMRIDNTADARAQMRELGRFLNGERELRQIPLDEVAAETKIPRRTLELLEEGRWNELPAQVFVRGFVRSYARCVGLDEKDTVERYLAIERGRAKEIAEQPGEPVGDAASEVKARRRFGLALFVIIVLIIATITLSLLWRKSGPTDIQARVDAPTSVVPASLDTHDPHA